MDAWFPAQNPKAPNLREGSALKGCRRLWALLGGPWEPPRSHGHYRKANRHVCGRWKWKIFVRWSRHVEQPAFEVCWRALQESPGTSFRCFKSLKAHKPEDWQGTPTTKATAKTAWPEGYQTCLANPLGEVCWRALLD